LYGVTNLNPDLKKQIEKQYPQLLEPNYNVLGCNDKVKGEYFSDYIKKTKQPQQEFDTKRSWLNKFNTIAIRWYRPVQAQSRCFQSFLR
jgi:hypothetical protein